MLNILSVEWMAMGATRLAVAAKERGAVLHVFAKNPGRFSHDIQLSGPCDALILHQVDTGDPEAVKKAVDGIGEIHGLVTVTEHCGWPTYEYLSSLGLPGQNVDSMRLLRDKTALRKHLHRTGHSSSAGIGVKVAEAGGSTFAELGDRLGLPFLVKHSAGAGSKFVWLIRDRGDFDDFLREAREGMPDGEVVAESYFIGTLYSAETITWEGETKMLGIASRVLSPEPHFREEAYGFPVLFPEERQAEIEAWIRDVLAATGYDNGLTHTEFIITKDGFEIVEINARIAGTGFGDMLDEVYGLNIYEDIIDMALGVRPKVMDTELVPRKGTAIIFLYPLTTGVYQGTDGAETLERHPGDPVLHQDRPVGSEIVSVYDQYGTTGWLLAGGETTEIALLNALSAAGKLHFRMGANGSG
ncbi:ATP-grasp domain-containing protein [Actinomadura sp. KC216]|uniref:ATP-grasp domain-containing protein n=1 Tax=Actinomadura sp. KC216 TaxID=2530370 RepID=UPI0010464E32|nr:ATP-grasp domain-containing protein [Actinomadura sp. KC216]TDB90337.1 ATP-grasp domain-containing protein [Actinomadura sp. KC216]